MTYRAKTDVADRTSPPQGGWRSSLWLLLICVLLATAAWAQENPPAKSSDSAQTDENVPVIEATPLPDAYPKTVYLFRFHATGGVPPLRWKLQSGSLPRAMNLTSDGVLNGAPESPGEFHFTVSVIDSAEPRHAVQRQFTLRVLAAMSMEWKTMAHVNGNRIEGAVEVANETQDEIDLTFDAKAVAQNGRATEIGYQHFSLSPKIHHLEIPFGETLPSGSYKIYLLAVGEVARKKLIYREQLDLPMRLTITIGP